MDLMNLTDVPSPLPTKFVLPPYTANGVVWYTILMTLTLLRATTITGLIAFAGQKFPRLAIGASTWYTLIFFSEPLRHRFAYTFAFLLSIILGGVFGFHLYPTHKRVGHFFIGMAAPLGLVDAIAAAALDRMSLLLNQLNIKAPLEPAEMATVVAIAFGLAIVNGWLTLKQLSPVHLSISMAFVGSFVMAMCVSNIMALYFHVCEYYAWLRLGLALAFLSGSLCLVWREAVLARQECNPAPEESGTTYDSWHV